MFKVKDYTAEEKAAWKEHVKDYTMFLADLFLKQ